VSPSAFHLPTAAGTILSMSTCRIGLAALAAIGLAALSCGEGGTAERDRLSARASDGRPADRSQLAALVDGRPIRLDDVRALMTAASADAGADAGLTVAQAVDALVDESLLAQEAARRGVGGADVAVERERALVRRLIEKIRAEVTADAIDPKLLAEAYAAQKERFVHGAARRVVHAVAKFAKRGEDDPAAKAVATEIRAAENGAASEDDFEARAKPFLARKDVAVAVERLPPFTAADTRFAREFVGATFDVPRVGGVAGPFRTPFGWHVLFVAEKLPAQDLSFEAARGTIAVELVPRERQRRLVELLDRLTRDEGVFVYDSTVPAPQAAP
jgi:peptidyl-prolyl cis-trans isomerase C